MIAMRFECDAKDCDRHFNVAGHELMPRPMAGTDDSLAVVFAAPYVLLPVGWIAGEVDDTPGLQVLCRDHAAEATG